MKIIIVNSYFSFAGGSAIAAYDIYKLLKEHGHEVFFFATDKKPYFEENYEYAKYFPECSVTPVDFIKHPLRFYYNLKARKNFEKMLDEIKPDIVHCHVLYHLTSSILEPCFKRNIPVIKHLHDATAVCPAFSALKSNKSLCNDVLCADYNYWNCIKYNCCQNNIEKSIRFAFYNFFNHTRRMHSKISAYISPSKAITDFMIKSHNNISKEKIYIISNFLNVDEPISKENSTGKYFLYVGSLTYIKGVHNIIRAAKMLPEEIKIHIVGSGPNEKLYKKEIEDNKITNVEFIGYLNRKELDSEYANCIAVIQSSIYYEAFGLTVIEAFAHSKPVIAANSGALPELIDNYKNGIIYSANNPEELAEKIKYLYENKGLAEKMGICAKQDFLDKYTKEIFYKKLISVYESVLKN